MTFAVISAFLLALFTWPGLVFFALWTVAVAVAAVAWHRRALRRDPEGTLRKVMKAKRLHAQARASLEEALAKLRSIAD